MELDDLKNTWEQYNQKLTQQLNFNEELLKKMNLERSKKELNGPLYYEISGILMLFVFTAVLIRMTLSLSDQIEFLIPGIISVILCLIFMVMSVKKVSLITNIEYFGTPVVNLQKSITALEMSIIKFRKIELYLTTPLLISCFPVMYEAIYEINLFHNLELYFIITGVSVLISIPLILWVYKMLYSKKVKNINHFLEEIERFENQ